MSNRVRNNILKATYIVAIIILLVSLSAFDSDTTIQYYTAILSGIYLVLGGIANGIFD